MIKFTKQRIAITKNKRLKKFQVLEILELTKCVEIPHMLIAEMFGVSISTVYFISCGYRWKNLTRLYSPVSNNAKLSKNAKFTAQQVKNIRNKWNKGTSQNALAKKYKISQPVVFDIVHRRTYRSVGN